MEKIFNNKGFEYQQLECPECGWKGEGSDANIIDLYGVADTSEIHCPQCDAFMGSLKTED